MLMFAFGETFDPNRLEAASHDTTLIAVAQKKLIASDPAIREVFGDALAMSGDTAIIGAQQDGAGFNGAAYIFTRSGNTWSEQQKLTALDGAADDRFGTSVAISGDTVVIGAPFDNDMGGDSGSAYVFVRSGTTWTEQQKLTPADGADDDRFGIAVSLIGNTVVVGTPHDDDACPTDPNCNSGSTYVFTRSGTTWTEQDKLIASDAAAGDKFGTALSFSGDRVVIGAPFDEDTIFDSGSAYVFVRSGTTWTEEDKLKASDPTVNDQFGTSVALDGDTALVGAIFGRDTGPQTGAAYVFTRSASTWSEEGRLAPGDGAQADHFGASVALSGNTALIGSRFNDAQAPEAGAAYLFSRAGNVWTSEGKLTAADGAQNDAFGEAVALSGTAALVGALGDDGATGSVYPHWIFPHTSLSAKLTASDAEAGNRFGSAVSTSGTTALVGSDSDDDACPSDPQCNSGSAFVFQRSGGLWAEQAKLTASDTAAGDLFGVAVGISGDTAVVGASQDADKGTNSGSAYVFVRSGDTWTQQQKLTALDGAASDFFGTAAAISGDTAVIGASWDDDKGAESGSAYVFVRSGTTWTQQQKLTALDGAASDFFGAAVAISNDTIIVGASQDDDKGGESGSAYVFFRSGTTWTQQQKLTASDGAAIDFFGASVSIAGETVLIGALLDDDACPSDANCNSGSAYVFTRSGTSWTEQQKLTAPDGAGGDRLGISVSVSGDTAFIGADEGNTLSARGSAYAFTRSDTKWAIAEKWTAGDAADLDFFGLSVSVWGDTKVIGANQDDDDGMDSGSVYVLGPPQVDLSVSQSDTPDPVTAGGNITYTITIANNGIQDATGVVFTDTLPSNTSFVSANATQGSCQESGGTLTCDIGLMSSGSTVTVTLVLNATTEGTVTHTVSVNADQTEPDTGNNAATETTTVNANPSQNNPPSIPELVAPENGAAGLGDTVTFSWNASSDPERDALSYQLVYCEDVALTVGCNSAQVTKAEPSLFAASAGAGLIFFGIVLVGRRFGGRNLVMGVVVLCFSTLLLLACGGSGGGNGSGGGGGGSGDFNHTVSSLKSGTNYFWKITADDGAGGLTDSEIRSFNTQ